MVSSIIVQSKRQVLLICNNSNNTNTNITNTGIERYEIRPVQSSADIYRQMRANGQLGIVLLS
jgi:hypothetical protein